MTSHRRAALGAGLLAMLPGAAGATPQANKDARLLALAAKLRGAHAREVEAVQVLMRAEAARDGLGTQNAAAAADAAFDTRTVLMEEVAGLPAEGLAGISVKAALVCRAMERGSTAADSRVAESLLADIARLAPSAASGEGSRLYARGTPTAER